MRFFSEIYHESTQYTGRGSGDPVILHWEKQEYADKRYSGMFRFRLNPSSLPVHCPVSADAMKSVNVYAVVRDGDVPDGVYFFDAETSELVKIRGKEALLEVEEAFTEKDFVKEAQVLYIYTGVLETAVWKFREAAYRQVQMDVGAACANTMLFEKSQGRRAFALGGFVDDSVSVLLKLGSTEMPLAAVAVFPEKSMVAFNSVDDGMGEFAYSNHGAMFVNVGDDGVCLDLARYSARFLLQNRMECINELNRSMKVRRVVTQGLDGEEFPLTPSKFSKDYFFREIWFLAPRLSSALPFVQSTMDLDDFSSMLRWLELCHINAFGAGLLKIWVVVFDVMFVYSGVYRYIPVRKSIYMQAGDCNSKKFAKCFAVPEQVQNASFAVVMTADLKEACGLLGERAYRYLNLNAGYLTEFLDASARLLNKVARPEHFFFHDELRKKCGIPESESIFASVVVGKCRR